jgi:hypothetical protein
MEPIREIALGQPRKPRIAPHRTTGRRQPVCHRRSAPLVATRVAGHQSSNEDYFDRIYFGPTSDFGRLNGHVWYRMRREPGSSRPDAWRVCMDACGHEVYLDAVIDDFGNLVATSS